MALSPIGRVSFPSVYEAKAMEGGKPKFYLTLIFKPEQFGDDQKELFNAMIDAAQKCAQETFKVKLGETYKGKPLASPFRRGEEKPDYYEADDVFVKFSSLKAPNVVDEGRVAIPQSSGEFYAGCEAHVTWEAYAYDVGGNRGVGFGLRNVQKTGKGEAFGETQRSAEDDFQVLDAAKAAGNGEDIPF